MAIFYLIQYCRETEELLGFYGFALQSMVDLMFNTFECVFLCIILRKMLSSGLCSFRVYFFVRFIWLKMRRLNASLFAGC